MYKYSKDGISVLSVLDARRAKKSGLFPGKIQVIHNRRQKYYSTGQELSKEDWANLAESKSRRLTEARSNIENSFSIIKGQVEALAERGDFAFDLLSVRLGRCSTATVNAAIKAKTEELKRNGQAGTYRSYHALLTAVEEFAGKDIPFSAVTVDWLNRCGRFWTGQKKSKSTLSVYFKMLKAIMNRAKADGIIKEAHFPFGRSRFEIQRHRLFMPDHLSRGQEAGTHAGTDKEARHLYRREGGNRALPGHVVLLLPLQRHQLPGHALSYLRKHSGR